MENKKLKQENQNLKNLLNKDSVEIITPRSNNIHNHMREADEAMNRYSDRIRKETLKYAKQKQSKRKSS